MRSLIVVVMGALLSSCSSEKETGRVPDDGSAEQVAVATAEEDVSSLGREIFDLIDRAMAYRSAHRGQLPRNLRELGIDELTPTTSRSLSVDGNVPTVTVSFRAANRHTVESCRATNAILEEASLASGTFSLICNLVGGGTTTLKAAR